MGGRALDFYAEAIVGWRSWTLRPDGCVVGLWQQGVVWPSGRPLQAMCCAPALGFGPRHVDPAPGPEHSCGIHAWKRPEHVQRAPLDWVVYGEVNLWGRVIDCDRGWRAQYAYPRRLWA